ncbi:tRNA pseudouridine(55) synthase TruB [Allosphingosinicella flava]|uniref:tRNA pseudouridine synthase B n=1 Tax=Allosphingosinicella flava TaxID=2771430 RepID=A0A7T2GJ17_9SPHN|nr:tRNA pseudouridine(55) synthase TruB [Sphingosinicella flava]QPQ54777.1 tRNA pseudouridine(55) synthase TruB [Sphingosinicella flava]
MHGWLIVDKPLGPGSTDIVSAVKRALRDGGYPKMKVGHGGTLDPLASGVLPVALGEATKLSGRMLDADKVYDFTIRFGEETSTLDAEGEVVMTSDMRPTLADMEAVLPRFTGAIEQIPPIYSALKVGGKRAYDLARAGEEVKLAARSVTIRSLALAPHPSIPSPEGEGRDEGKPLPFRGGVGVGAERSEVLNEITLTARVSKGTYIRALARDIAYALDTVGHVTMLRRTKAGPFTLEQAISLDKLREAAKARELEQHLLPLTAGLDDIPALPVTPDQAGALRQGRTLIGIAAKPGLHLAIENDVPVALVELCEGELRVVRGFNL